MSSYVSEVAISGNGVRHNVSESSSVLDNSITISGKGVILDGEGDISQLDIQHLLSSRHLVLNESEVTAEFDTSLVVSGRQLNINTTYGTTIIDVSQQMGGAGSHTGIITYWSSDYDSVNKEITLNSPIGVLGQITTPHKVSLVGHNHDSRYYIEGDVFHIGSNTYEIYKQLSRLTDDVLISSPADGHILKWSSQLNKWVNAPNEGGTGASLFQIDGSDVKPKESRNIKTPNYITIGVFKIEEEVVTVSGAQVKRLRISRTDNTSADLYTTGGLTAYGQGSGGGGGGGVSNLYQLSDVPDYRTSYRGKILKSKSDGSGVEWVDMPNSAVWGNITGTLSAQTDLVNALAGKAALSHTHIKSQINDFAHTHSISDVTGLQTALDGKQAAISDLTTIRSNAANGNTAYGWGNHATEGYLTGITKTMVENVLTGDISSHTHSQYLTSAVAETTYHPKGGSTELALSASSLTLSGAITGATDITASGSISTNTGFHQAIDTCLYCNNNPWMWPRYSDGWMYTNTDTNGWRIRNRSSNFLMTIMGGGNVGIGTTTPSEKLEIKGGKLKLTSADGTKSVTLELDNSGNLKINGNVLATGAVTAYQTN